MNVKRRLILTLLVALPFFAAADFTAPRWQYERPITLPPSGEQGYVRTTLDRSVAAGSSQFKDVRVVRDSDGGEVPYQLVVKDASVDFATVNSTIIDSVTDGSRRRMFILDVGTTGFLHNRISIETSSPNYRRQVSVYAASTLLPHSSSGWNLLTSKGYIFKFTNPTDNVHTEYGEVAYPESSARYLRVIVEAGPEGALTLSSAGVHRQEIGVAEEESQTVTADVIQHPKDQTTEIIADLGASGIPTEQIELSVDNRGNFSRSAYLSGSDDASAWFRVGQGYLSQVDTPKFTGSNLSIRYPESSYRYYKIDVQNFDDAPLQIGNRVRVTNTVRTVVFEAVPTRSYKLYYGNKSAFAPRYDLSRYFAYLDTAALPEAHLGAESVNPKYVAPAPPVIPFTERNKVLLNITLAMLVLLIAACIFWYIWRYLHPHALSATPPAPLPVPPVTPPVAGNEPPKQQ